MQTKLKYYCARCKHIDTRPTQLEYCSACGNRVHDCKFYFYLWLSYPRTVGFTLSYKINTELFDDCDSCNERFKCWTT